MSLVRPITRRDIQGPMLYGPIRDRYFWRVVELKRARRIFVGDRVSLVFENRHTLSLQIEEICRVEGLLRDDQIESEIAVYNQLMPTESSLSATLFIEPPGDAGRHAAVEQLLGLDEHVVLHVGGHAIRAAFEPGRSTEDRISAVQYTRYALSAEARAALATPGTELAVEIDHPNYRHRVACSEATRASLAGDYA
jgi:uncharacterized protein DUF3501